MSHHSQFKRSARGARLLATGLLAGLMALGASSASAALVTSRGALGGTDFIDWGQLGADGTAPGATGAVVSNGLVGATFSTPASTAWRFDEGGSFAGNFAVGDRLLATFFELGPIVIDFSAGQSRVGAQIQSIDYGLFTGMIEVFDSLNNSLESWTFGGNSNANQDNSAIFLGVSRASADIARVVFNVSGSANLDFAINQLDLSDRVDVNPTPEPASLALVGLALAGVVGTRRRKAA